jgi:hypothetical protein
VHPGLDVAGRRRGLHRARLFSPSRREVLTGSLTVSSPLAGATELPLAVRGIVPPLLVVERELNFGRMLDGAGHRTRCLH